MKAYLKLLVLINFAVLSSLFLFYAVLCLLLLFSSTQGFNDKLALQKTIPQNQVLGTTNSGLPARLVIPAINVNDTIQSVGVDSRGEMEVPSNAVDVGWFKLGPRPGEKGSAVISGHFDGENGEQGVFNNLHKLKKGDKLYVEDDKGTTYTFIVRESRIYDPGYAEEVFSLNDKAHLNLITCDGTWDGVKKSYTKRLVVFTDMAN